MEGTERTSYREVKHNGNKQRERVKEQYFGGTTVRDQRSLGIGQTQEKERLLRLSVMLIADNDPVEGLLRRIKG